MLKNLVLFIVLFQSIEAFGQVCGSAFQKLISNQGKSISKIEFQVQAANATVGTQFQFPTYNFLNNQVQNIGATVRYYAPSVAGTSMSIWVADDQWNASSPNLLNHQGVNSQNLSILQADRASTISEIAQVLEQVVMPVMEGLFGSIPDPENTPYTGVHFLLYDIRDDFEVSGTFVGGYFLPDDQENPGLNLLHMDINPLIPSDRETEHPIPRDDFYHTLVHELFHLFHFHKAGDSRTWYSIGAWIVEGTAQFAIHRVLKGLSYPGSTEKILKEPERSVSQIPFYLQSPNTTYLLDFNDGLRQIPVEYYGLGYLFFTYLWNQLGDTDEKRDAVFSKLLQRNVQGSAAFKRVLSEEGFDFNSIYEDFVLAQYFDTPEYSLDFVKIHDQGKKTKVQLDPFSSVEIDQLPQSSLAIVHPYDVRYLEIKNLSENTMRLDLESQCPDQPDPCGSCSSPREFELALLPSRDRLLACTSTADYYECVNQSLNEQFRMSGTRFGLDVNPGTHTLAFWTTKDSAPQSCSQGFHKFALRSSSTVQDPPTGFDSNPSLRIQSNTLNFEFDVSDPESFSLDFRVKRNGVSQKLNSSTQTSTRTNSIEIQWHYLEDFSTVEGLDYEFLLFEKDSINLLDRFRFHSFSTFPVQRSSYGLSLNPGWNMIALHPDSSSLNYLDLQSLLNSNVQSSSHCAYYFDERFYGIPVLQNTCESQEKSGWQTRPWSGTEALFVHSNTSQQIEILSFDRVRNRLPLKIGWNLAGLNRNQSLEELSNSLPGSVPLIFHWSSDEQRWLQTVLYGENASNGFSTQSIFSRGQAFWIYNLIQREYQYPGN